MARETGASAGRGAFSSLSTHSDSETDMGGGGGYGGGGGGGDYGGGGGGYSSDGLANGRPAASGASHSSPARGAQSASSSGFAGFGEEGKSGGMHLPAGQFKEIATAIDL